MNSSLPQLPCFLSCLPPLFPWLIALLHASLFSLSPTCFSVFYFSPFLVYFLSCPIFSALPLPCYSFRLDWYSLPFFLYPYYLSTFLPFPASLSDCLDEILWDTCSQPPAFPSCMIRFSLLPAETCMPPLLLACLPTYLLHPQALRRCLLSISYVALLPAWFLYFLLLPISPYYLIFSPFSLTLQYSLLSFANLCLPATFHHSLPAWLPS